jgi:hypothetical protein
VDAIIQSLFEDGLLEQDCLSGFADEMHMRYGNEEVSASLAKLPMNGWKRSAFEAPLGADGKEADFDGEHKEIKGIIIPGQELDLQELRSLIDKIVPTQIAEISYVK